MKYLKRFNESIETIDEIKQTIKDILLPISDMGYDISVITNKLPGMIDSELVIRVVEWTDKPLLITDGVKEEFIRMSDYLKSEGFNSIEVRYYIKLGQNTKEFDDFINFIDIEYPIENLLFVAKKGFRI